MKFILSALLVLVTSGCKNKETPPSENSSCLMINLNDDLTSLDPRQVRWIRDLSIVNQLFEGLMRMDENGVPGPGVASEVSLSDDKLTYTFSLRKAHWSNGAEITAEDFVNAWRDVVTPSFACDYSYLFYPIKNGKAIREGQLDREQLGVSAINAHTLVVYLENPTPYFLELTCFPTFFPVPSTKGEGFISNGPFSLEKWIPERELLLKKNSHYWDQERVYMDRITCTVLKDSMTEAYLFEKGKLDWLGQPLSANITPEVLGKMRESRSAYSYAVAGTCWIECNTQKEPLHNVNMRKALSLSIHRKKLIDHLLEGEQVVATGPLPPCMSLQETTYFNDGDTAFAKELFEQAMQEEGWALGSMPPLTLSYHPSERNNKIAQFLKEEWKEALGIDVELGALDRHLYKRNCKIGNFQIGIGDWIADFNDPIAFLELFKYREGMNSTGWNDSHYTGLLDQSLQEKDTSVRKELLHEAEKMLVDNMPIIPLYHCSWDYAKKAEVSGVILSPLGIVDFKRTKKVS